MSQIIDWRFGLSGRHNQKPLAVVELGSAPHLLPRLSRTLCSSSPAMLATCPICFEELGDKFPPVVLPCGHLYCLDCATFWFNQGDGPQACTSRCPEKYTGDQIIKVKMRARASGRTRGEGLDDCVNGGLG